jgi:undecaprenyl-diphosphatase
VLALWGCGALVRSYAGAVDLSAVRDLAALRNSALTAVARALSVVGSGYVVLPLAFVSAAVLVLVRRRGAAVLIAVSTYGAVVIENLDKLLVSRPRPPVRHLELVTSSSFPSGHATQSAAYYGSAMLVMLSLLARRGRTPRLARAAVFGLVTLLVCAICFSRVYLGVHYPTDVAAGLLLSGLWIALVRRHTPGPGVAALKREARVGGLGAQ